MFELVHIALPFDARTSMRITLTIDDELFDKAVALAEPGMAKSQLLKVCVQAFIQRQAGRRLAALGGQAADVELAPRGPEQVSAG